MRSVSAARPRTRPGGSITVSVTLRPLPCLPTVPTAPSFPAPLLRGEAFKIPRHVCNNAPVPQQLASVTVLCFCCVTVAACVAVGGLGVCDSPVVVVCGSLQYR